MKGSILKVFFFIPTPLKFFAGKLGRGSPSVHSSGLITEGDVSLLAAALRIQV